LKGVHIVQNRPDLRILFPTSYSDACFRTSRAIAQLADRCHISLTIAHITAPGAATIGSRRELDSFMAEADHYDECCRMLVESPCAVEAIGNLCDCRTFDLVLAPASDRVGLHRFFTRSTRARLLKRCPVPIWTAGKCLDRRTLKPAITTVACLLDFDAPGDAHIRLASSLASRVGAKLRIVTVIEPISEATLAKAVDSRAPLVPEVAIKAIRSAFDGVDCPDIDVSVGDMSLALPRLLQRCDADLVFIGPGRALAGLWRPKLASYVDRLPCPVICVDGASAQFEAWSYESERSAYLPPVDRALAS
jgi:hypothetical protein